jgi:hypothetical protein
MAADGGVAPFGAARSGRALRVEPFSDVAWRDPIGILPEEPADHFCLVLVDLAQSRDAVAIAVVDQLHLVAVGEARRGVLSGWCPSYPGYHLYYPTRRQSPAAFKVVLNALRQE